MNGQSTCTERIHGSPRLKNYPWSSLAIRDTVGYNNDDYQNRIWLEPSQDGPLKDVGHAPSVRKLFVYITVLCTRD